MPTQLGQRIDGPCIDDSMAPAYSGLGAGRGEFLDEAAIRVEVAVDVVV
ncbi:MAG: hypothetical protein ABWY20_15545 [Mycobacterium sp.]